MFDTTKEDLKDILRKIEAAHLQLPDFQRDYVWQDDDVRSLIASIAKGFPVGALLTLETGGNVRFKPRCIAGVPAKTVEPVELLLDGQQRMTSLYQATFSQHPVKTLTPRNTTIDRYYYLDINRSLEEGADLMDAIIGVPADRIVRCNFGRDVELDLSTPQKEYEASLFPLNQVFDSHTWLFKWAAHWQSRKPEVSSTHREFYQRVVEKIDRYKMPTIRLDRTNSREAICLVFEKVNVGGKKLDAFELVTAIYASDHFDLREDWLNPQTSQNPGRRAKILGHPYPRDVLKEIANTDFLQSCTLLHTLAVRQQKYQAGRRDKELPQVSCSREALLALPLEAYRRYADAVERGFIDAAAFMNELKIIWHKDVPYPPILVALASVFAILGAQAKTVTANQILRRWFWSVTLGELYGSMTDSRLSRDVPELVEWLQGNTTKTRSIDESVFQDIRLQTLRSRLSAAYKGLHALMMGHGCRDFISGRPVDIMTFFNDKIDIHHIFPQDWCKKQNPPIDPGVYNAIINKTPLSKASNIAISGDAPSVYLRKIEQKHGVSPETLDDILRTHLIDPIHLRTDDFQAFFKARARSLAGLVEDAMGKPVVLVRTETEPEFPYEPFDEEEADQDDEELI